MCIYCGFVAQYSFLFTIINSHHWTTTYVFLFFPPIVLPAIVSAEQTDAQDSLNTTEGSPGLLISDLNCIYSNFMSAGIFYLVHLSFPLTSGPSTDHHKKRRKERDHDPSSDFEDEGDFEIDEATGAPVKRELLKRRDFEVDLDSKLGKSVVITKNTPNCQTGG